MDLTLPKVGLGALRKWLVLSYVGSEGDGIGRQAGAQPRVCMEGDISLWLSWKKCLPRGSDWKARPLLAARCPWGWDGGMAAVLIAWTPSAAAFVKLRSFDYLSEI